MSGSERSWWVRWHDDSDDPDSDLSRRLGVIQRRLRETISAAEPGPIATISECAGQGHDVIGAHRATTRAADVRALLVEEDPENGRIARTRSAAAGLTGIEVVQGDAGTTDAYRDAVPADVLLLCGIFGNVPIEDVRTTVIHAPMLCASGATVLWTCRRREPDRTPAIRRWTTTPASRRPPSSGGPDRYAVGVERLVTEPPAYLSGLRLFTFEYAERSRAGGLWLSGRGPTIVRPRVARTEPEPRVDRPGVAGVPLGPRTTETTAAIGESSSTAGRRVVLPPPAASSIARTEPSTPCPYASGR